MERHISIICRWSKGDICKSVNIIRYNVNKKRYNPLTEIEHEFGISLKMVSVNRSATMRLLECIKKTSLLAWGSCDLTRTLTIIDELKALMILLVKVFQCNFIFKCWLLLKNLLDKNLKRRFYVSLFYVCKLTKVTRPRSKSS